jgi:hypothetical protein
MHIKRMSSTIMQTLIVDWPLGALQVHKGNMHVVLADRLLQFLHRNSAQHSREHRSWDRTHVFVTSALSSAQASYCTMPCGKTNTWKTKNYGWTVMMDLRETVCEKGRWMELAQDRRLWYCLFELIKFKKKLASIIWLWRWGKWSCQQNLVTLLECIQGRTRIDLNHNQ